MTILCIIKESNSFSVVYGVPVRLLLATLVRLFTRQVRPGAFVLPVPFTNDIRLVIARGLFMVHFDWCASSFVPVRQILSSEHLPVEYTYLNSPHKKTKPNCHIALR